MSLKDFIYKNLLKLIKKPYLKRYERDKLKFSRRYPNYDYGVMSYGVPEIRTWNKHLKVSIGAYCSIAKNNKIILGGNHRYDWVTTYPFPGDDFFPELKISGTYSDNGDVVIGSDVWICENCIILSGVHVGHGAVIGAGSVVTKDVPPYAIVAGNPAKVIKFRFEPVTIAILLESEWWKWPEAEVLEVASLMCTNNFNEFVQYVKSRH